jgi:hypothetical protein
MSFLLKLIVDHKLKTKMEIKHAKLTKEFTIDLSYFNDGVKVKGEEHPHIAHSDLVGAFAKLTIHYGLMTYFIQTKSVKEIRGYDEKLISDLHVSSYHIGGAEDDKNIIICGHRILPNGKALIANTPFYRFDEADANGYKFIQELQEDIETLESEIDQYLNGKHAPDPQGDLFADPDAMKRIADADKKEEQEDIDEELDAAPKKKSAKKIKK